MIHRYMCVCVHMCMRMCMCMCVCHACTDVRMSTVRHVQTTYCLSYLVVCLYIRSHHASRTYRQTLLYLGRPHCRHPIKQELQNVLA